MFTSPSPRVVFKQLVVSEAKRIKVRIKRGVSNLPVAMRLVIGETIEHELLVDLGAHVLAHDAARLCHTTVPAVVHTALVQYLVRRFPNIEISDAMTGKVEHVGVSEADGIFRQPVDMPEGRWVHDGVFGDRADS